MALPVAAIAMLAPLRLSSPSAPSGGPLLRFWLLYGAVLILLVTSGMVVSVGFACWMELPRGVKMFQLSSTCRVLSKGVDLKTAEVCTSLSSSGDSSQQNIRINSRKDSQLRCYFEYYWASVFEVEFRPKTSSLPFQAAVEAPPLLLPSSCRPSFRAAWKKKERYKINSTYPCRYSPSALHVVQLVEEDNVHQNCTETDSSTWKYLQNFLLQLFYSEKSIISVSTKNGQLLGGLVSGIFEGILLSVLAHLLTKSTYLTLMRSKKVESTTSDRSQEIKWILFQVRMQSMMLFFWFFFTVFNLSLCDDSTIVLGIGLENSFSVRAICRVFGFKDVLPGVLLGS